MKFSAASVYLATLAATVAAFPAPESGNLVSANQQTHCIVKFEWDPRVQTSKKNGKPFVSMVNEALTITDPKGDTSSSGVTFFTSDMPASPTFTNGVLHIWKNSASADDHKLLFSAQRNGGQAVTWDTGASTCIVNNIMEAPANTVLSMIDVTCSWKCA